MVKFKLMENYYFMYKNIFIICLFIVSLFGCSSQKECCNVSKCSNLTKNGVLIVSSNTLDYTNVPDYTPIGACNLLNGDCITESEHRCEIKGGTYLGDGSQCPLGTLGSKVAVCCFIQDGGQMSCAVTIEKICDIYKGEWFVLETECGPRSCTEQ